MMNNLNSNPGTRNLVIGGLVYLGSVYFAYAYGQKNPNKNLLDIPPKEYPHKAYEKADQAQRCVDDKTNQRK